MIQLNDELKRVAAHAADLRQKLEMRNADAFGKLHTPTLQHSQQHPPAQHGPTTARAPNQDIQAGILAARAKAHLVTERSPRAPPPGLDAGSLPTPSPCEGFLRKASPCEDFARKLLEHMTILGEQLGRSTPRRTKDCGSEDRLRYEEEEPIEVPPWSKAGTLNLWMAQLTQNANAAAVRPDDMTIAWLNQAMDNSCNFDNLAVSEDRFQVLDRKLAKSLMEILPIALLCEIMLEEMSALTSPLAGKLSC